MSDQAVRKDLEQAAGKPVESAVPFSRMTTIGCGGPAAFLVVANSSNELVKILAATQRHQLPWVILGQGSNLLVADTGFEGVALRLAGGLKTCRSYGERLDCGAGVSLPRAARAAYENGLTGLEPLEGIPGTVGGAVAMNAGAFGTSIGDRVVQLELCQADGIRILTTGKLEFGYRSSSLPAGTAISRVTLLLETGEKEGIRAAMRRYLSLREGSQPRGVRTFGSVFKNPAGSEAAGRLLDRAGCKGLSRGSASVSEVHANFIINQGGAKTADIIWLINECRRRVFKQSGVLLEPEVKILGDIVLEQP